MSNLRWLGWSRGARAKTLVRITANYCCVFFLLLGPALAFLAKADTDMPSEMDKVFARVITSIGELRQKDQASLVIVTPLFKPLTDRLSLAELREYLARRYRLKRAKDVKGNYEYGDIDTDELLAADKRFHSQDILRFGFRYDASWKAITEFQAELLGGQF